MSKSTKPKPAKTPVVTADYLMRAARRSIRAVCKSGCVKASTDAGFAKITGKYPYRSGYQVFVVVEPWSDEALIEFPESGGLLNLARDIAMAREWSRKRGKKGGAK